MLETIGEVRSSSNLIFLPVTSSYEMSKHPVFHMGDNKQTAAAISPLLKKWLRSILVCRDEIIICIALAACYIQNVCGNRPYITFSPFYTWKCIWGGPSSTINR